MACERNEGVREMPRVQRVGAEYDMFCYSARISFVGVDDVNGVGQ